MIGHSFANADSDPETRHSTYVFERLQLDEGNE